MACTFRALLLIAVTTCSALPGRSLQVDPLTPNEWASRDGLHKLTWQAAGTFLQATASARPRGINPPGYVAFGFTDNGKMVSSGGASLVLVGMRPTTLAPPVGRRLQQGLPPPPGGAENEALKVYLVKTGGVPELIPSTNPALASCGLNLNSADVQAVGTSVELKFSVSILQEGDTTCTINGLTVPGFKIKTKHFAHVITAMGDVSTFGQQNEDDWEDAYDVLCDQPDGSCTGEGGLQAALGAVAGLALLAFGYKFYQDKQAEKEGGAAPPPPGAQMAAAAPPGGGYPAMQQPAAQQYPQQAGPELSLAGRAVGLISARRRPTEPAGREAQHAVEKVGQ